MNNIVETDYLTWEYCTDPDIQYLDCPPPEPVHKHLPQWFKNLKARRDQIPFAEQQTVRNCLGFRGLISVGYTIPLPEELTGNDTYFSRGRLHPDMIYGTKFANKPGGPWTEPNGNIDHSPYQYRLRILHWPWRAKMSPGWRLVILPYLLDWNDDWNEFSGTVEPNYDIQHNTGIGSGLKWAQQIDHNYNYYNLETVIAYKRNVTVNKGTLTFCAVPLYDPKLKEKQHAMD